MKDLKIMLLEIESEILLAAMNFVKMEGEYALETSCEIIKKEGKILSWYEVYSKNSFISNELHNDWIEKNKYPVLLTSLKEEIKIHFLFLEQFDSLYKSPEKAWSVFYSITRPGISPDGQTAIVQIIANCPSGQPNYASLLFLEKSVHFWNVNSTHSIYTNCQK